MEDITEENYTTLDHISDEELQKDIDDILKENESYETQISCIRKTYTAKDKVTLYLTEGRLLANKTQLENLQNLQTFRKQRKER